MSKARGIFITGTDTGIGKTHVALGLMQLLRSAGFRVVGMKPVATGAFWSQGRLVNEDALLLQRSASISVPYEQVNPYVFEWPVSPHIAAKKRGQAIDLARIVRVYQDLEPLTDWIIVEGIGGWEVPLNDRQRVADLAVALSLPVILVIGLRLGCLNHALLTAKSLKSAGIRCLGWIANQIEKDFLFIEGNLETLKANLEWPMLSVFPFVEHGSSVDDPIFEAPPWDYLLRLMMDG
jgi:dethiobiotin synthetase